MADNDNGAKPAVPSTDVCAVYCNRFYLQATPDGVLMTFGESPDGSEKGENIHTRLFLPHSGGMQMGRIFENLYASIEQAKATKN